jgi:hypothetical protein
MEKKQSPRLRSVDKFKQLYPVNQFPPDFPLKLGKELVFYLATRTTPRIEGEDWEEIFARTIGADWKPSNVGLDDVVFEQMAWGAKTIKNNNPLTVRRIRLISGRNSPVYSFGVSKVSDCDPAELGEKVLDIWNERVSSVRRMFKHLRTIVLIKGKSLREVAVYEFDTIRYDSPLFWWQWNDNGNLEGYTKTSDMHVFTWQPHGSQFTIIESVPELRLAIRVKEPPRVSSTEVLKEIGFDNTWVEILSQP